MKYSNGFFLYHLLEDNRDRENDAFLSRKNHGGDWVPYNKIDSFNCYYFYILDHGFHEVPVWFDFERQYAVIFLINYELIVDVIQSIQSNFAYRCESISLLKDHTMSDINIVPEAGFVVTNLLKTDKDRISIIHEVIGEECNVY